MPLFNFNAGALRLNMSYSLQTLWTFVHFEKKLQRDSVTTLQSVFVAKASAPSEVCGLFFVVSSMPTFMTDNILFSYILMFFLVRLFTVFL